MNVNGVSSSKRYGTNFTAANGHNDSSSTSVGSKCTGSGNSSFKPGHRRNNAYYYQPYDSKSNQSAKLASTSGIKTIPE